MGGHLNGQRVAVIGGGPGGLTSAKHLIEHGAQPVVLEASDDIGGQWHRTAAHSGVWEGMCTNTSKTMTAFSDLPHDAGLALFPRSEDIGAYLRAYAGRFGVSERVRTSTRVTGVERDGAGWAVRTRDELTGRERSERFDRVVVAGGRFSRPRWPDVPGLGAFAPSGRVLHAADYRTRDEFRGQRVLVYGNSISGLEIASDLAMDSSIEVTSASRRARFILQKVVRGVPADWQWFTRFAALLGRALPPDALAAGLRDQLLAVAGDPADVGGLEPDPDVLASGISQCQHYLAMVAEGRIAVRPAISELRPGVAEFADGATGAFDAIVCATGYDLDLSYLAPEIRTILGADDTFLDLYARTLHPDLPGLAFVGQYVAHGPYFPLLELQARLLAGLWDGVVAGPGEAQMRADVEAYRQARPMLAAEPHHVLAGLFAGELGVVPSLTRRPQLTAALLFGPLAPAGYRLDGPGAQAGAEELLARALADAPAGAAAAGAPGPEQIGALEMIADVLGDDELCEAAALLARGEIAVAA
ncbi:flavin-containing monooxygenase [Capillimicrobium parvum]|uniref:Uncharacterized protein n=1 Tax=Capillimicrobium parvum TaxID=2884022 RepID=A0A9E7C0Y1_9ACTN|nr:FAD-dependent oxidoreductase [Capillimicrobium parvum]UGS36856.1 hypothetical protein DSM104329_03267 [Capillimicrobium parvum]